MAGHHPVVRPDGLVEHEVVGLAGEKGFGGVGSGNGHAGRPFLALERAEVGGLTDPSVAERPDESG